MIKVGYQADLVVFAPDTIADCGTFHNPLVGPTGIHHVLLMAS
ncbi:hypothetical protein [Bacillus salipaludis]|uniref:Uncharacterized protein n=1 Tax=Bacillus salipaludis TaxID=2547811 RepID=A0AA90TVB3_9BACI|nr:hypothetical protein [Bacillus salipaludis]MDQ6594958.1 hypothetical protein [Bacillus salipaludis]